MGLRTGIGGGLRRLGAQTLLLRQQAPRLARHRGTRVNQLHLRPQQGPQLLFDEDVMRATQHQRIHLTSFQAKLA